MTVAELIEKLREMPQEMEVYCGKHNETDRYVDLPNVDFCFVEIKTEFWRLSQPTYEGWEKVWRKAVIL